MDKREEYIRNLWAIAEQDVEDENAIKEKFQALKVLLKLPDQKDAAISMLEKYKDIQGLRVQALKLLISASNSNEEDSGPFSGDI